MSELIKVDIWDDGQVEVLVQNTREDLLHDFQYFLEQAQKHDPEVAESMFLHSRFLRVALLMLFAYTEAVVNGWVHALVEKGKIVVPFARIQRDCLNRKIEILNDLSSATVQKPNMKDAKEVRNLFVHFTPTREDEAFSRLTFNIVERVAGDVFRWMTEIESNLQLKRHANSDELSQVFAMGICTKSVSTDPKR